MPKQSSVRRETAGFTLLEVLVATAVMGTAVAALLSLLSGSLQNTARLHGPQQALALAKGELNELLVRSNRGRGEQTTSAQRLVLDHKIAGRWDEDYRWEAEATRFRSSPQRVPGEPILVRIVFDAYWRAGAGEEKQLTLETYELWQEPSGSRQ